MGAYLLPAKIVQYGVLQDAVEQHRKLLYRLVSIAFRELEHGILHDIQCGMLVAYGEACMFVRTAFDAG